MADTMPEKLETSEPAAAAAAAAASDDEQGDELLIAAVCIKAHQTQNNEASKKASTRSNDLCCLLCGLGTKNRQTSASKSISCNFFWAGVSNFAMDTLLRPLESRCATLSACVPRPGMYNLNAIRATVTDAATGATLLSAPLATTQCLVDVRSP